MEFVKSALAILALSASQVAVAATQGTPGPTSTGTVTINATITPEVQINNLNDLTFTATELRTALNTGADAVKKDVVCGFSNNPDRSYFVTATGDGSGGAFRLTDGTRSIAYSVEYLDGFGNGGALTAGTKSVAHRGSDFNCGGSGNAVLTINLANSVIGSMEATTTYTGVLTLLVTPT